MADYFESDDTPWVQDEAREIYGAASDLLAVIEKIRLRRQILTDREEGRLSSRDTDQMALIGEYITRLEELLSPISVAHIQILNTELRHLAHPGIAKEEVAVMKASETNA